MGTKWRYDGLVKISFADIAIEINLEFVLHASFFKESDLKSSILKG